MRLTHPRHQALLARVQPRLAEETDLAHDLDHVLRVYRWAVRLAEESGVDTDLAGAAALVHDLVNVPKESAQRSMGSALSAAAGAEVLPEVGYTPDEVEQIVSAVATCSWSRGLPPASPLGAILQDADRLDAIGAVGIARNFACAQAMASRGTSGRFYDPEDPLGQSARALDDKRNAADHYPIKLLRLAQTMHTPTAKAEAAHRHAFLLAFLEQLGRETS
ncbi:MAG: HD domain-containing protein [Myxococcota bacterium]|nr:HD domain-containing protein [Myxococcota bacterium]